MSLADRRIEALEAENAQLRDLLARSWTTVHKRARVVIAEQDLVVSGKTGKTWQVVSVATDAFDTTIVMLAPSGRRVERTTPRDAKVPVLMPIPMRDGMVLLRGGLGAQLVPSEDDDAHEPAAPPIEGAWRDGQVHLCPLVPQPHVALRDCVRYALDHGDQTFVGDPTFVP